MKDESYWTGYREALRDAADEVHREARWWEEQRQRGIQVVDPIGRWLAVEKILRSRAADSLAGSTNKPTCICDDASYYSYEENVARKPFLANANCPIHRPASGSTEPATGQPEICIHGNDPMTCDERPDGRCHVPERATDPFREAARILIKLADSKRGWLQDVAARPVALEQETPNG